MPTGVFNDITHTYINKHFIYALYTKRNVVPRIRLKGEKFTKRQNQFLLGQKDITLSIVAQNQQ